MPSDRLNTFKIRRSPIEKAIMLKPIILGVSASLRNARFGRGSASLLTEIKGLTSRETLVDYLEEQSSIITEQFFEAGRRDGLPFDELYTRFKKSGGDRGLSNSESAVVAALWGAIQRGCDIDHVSLSRYFSSTGETKNLEELRAAILNADGLILGGPVYFGDRGSLASDFIDFLGSDAELRAHLRSKIYGGVAVGAKRNGGQETNLIYQLNDMTNLGMLGVGNDSETTSQYGGTGVAGDVGTFHADGYGLDTCIGTGRRVGGVTHALASAGGLRLSTPLRVDVWLLQDSTSPRFRDYLESITAQLPEDVQQAVEFNLKDFSTEYIRRCIACDICPTEIGEADQYRCIISAKKDLFQRQHVELIGPDAILYAAYSPRDRSDIQSQYQKFVERTRYWRRDNYLVGDRLTAPFVISEVGANQNLHLRMLTSGVRHHAVMHRPVIGFEHKNALLNSDDMVGTLSSFVSSGIAMTTARLANAESAANTDYNPVGYVISKEKTDSDRADGRWDELTSARLESIDRQATERLDVGAHDNPRGSR